MKLKKQKQDFFLQILYSCSFFLSQKNKIGLLFQPR